MTSKLRFRNPDSLQLILRSTRMFDHDAIWGRNGFRESASPGGRWQTSTYLTELQKAGSIPGSKL